MDNYRLSFVFTLCFGYLMVSIIPGIEASVGPSNDNGVQNNNKDYYSVPRSVGSFGGGAPVYGIYRFKLNLYLVRDSVEHIEMYDVHLRNDWKGKLPASGMKGPYDMVGSDYSRSLFLSDWFNWSSIITVSTKSQNQVGSFPIDEPFTVVGLAATKQPSDSDVIVTCAQSLKIKEYTKLGTLVRQIQLPVEITQPRHAIKLSSGDGYVVCHGYGPDEKHRVCLLNITGDVVDCFGNDAGSGQKQLDVCSRVAEDDDQNILVADRNNKRVILLTNKNNKLKFEQEIVRNRDGLNGPTRILIDGPILYVVDNMIGDDGLAVSGKVLVFRVRDGQTNF